MRITPIGSVPPSQPSAEGPTVTGKGLPSADLWSPAQGDAVPPSRGGGVANDPVIARLGDRYEQREALALKALGCRPRSQAAAEVLGLRLPRWDEVDSREAIAALAGVDVGPLARAGVPPIAVFDFDNTLMTGELWVSFLAVAAHRRALDPASREGTVAEICARATGGVRPESFAGLDANDVMTRAVELFHAGRLTPTDMFFVGLGSLRGMTPATADALADELFEHGAPGQKPYKLNGFDPFPGPGDSAEELVAALRDRGIDAYVVTAGFTFLARRGCRYFGIPPERVFGADLEVEGGVCTGRAPDIVVRGKDNVVREEIGVPPLFVFGDSPRSDAPMMRLALGRGFMVEPPDSFVDLNARQGETHVVLRFGPRRG